MLDFVSRPAPSRLLLAVLFAAACTGAPAPDLDASIRDAGHDAATNDAGHDAAPPPGPRWCGLCHVDADCGNALCLSLGSGGAEHVCGAQCNTDLECDAIRADATCMEVYPGLPRQCVPRSGSCTVSAPGSPCSEAVPCTGTYDVCVSFDVRAPSVCTARCNTSADCPIGMRTCVAARDGTFCAPDATYGMDTCASGRSPASPLCACSAESATSISGALLASSGLDACDLRFDEAALDAFGPAAAHDRFRLDFTDRIRSYAPEVPRFGHEIAMVLDHAATTGTPVTSALTESATLADLAPLRPSVPTDATDLPGELAALITEAGGTPNLAELTSATGSLPPGTQATIAPIVRATRSALIAREMALAGLDAPTRMEAFDVGSAMFLPAVGFAISPADTGTQGLLLGDVRTDVIAQAAIDLSATLETYAIETLVGNTIHLFVDTPAGAIVMSGDSDDVHANPAILLLIDFGGDDTYRGATGATASPANGVSVVIDVAGMDTYGYAEVPVPSDTSGPPDSRRLPSDGGGRAPAGATNGPFSQSIASRQGAGRLGIGMLFDFGADVDHYRALRMSQGYGALGVGVLYDGGGDDVYEGEAAVQGAASFGLGLLYDRGGDDHYVAYAFAQGFGYSRGVGTLYDQAGTDDYFSHPTDVLYYSPQNPGGSNSSFSQGAGFGRRADFGDGVNMSGGLGVLRDATGDDTYTVGIFGQGTGYWFGTGLLLEGDGADHYDGWWYVHGSAAHYAVAALVDEGGGDTYQVASPGDPARNTSVGVGHDFSIGWLVDRGGDDVYHAPNLSLGSGNAAGYGFFVDLAGDDVYTATSDFSFGNASIESPGDTLRAMAGTLGLFVDRGGADSYTRPTPAPVAENATWTQEQHPGMGEHGAGVDVASGTVGLGLD